MAAPKGHKRYGGRKKGTSNKVTVELRERVKRFLDDGYDRFMECLNDLDSKDYIDTYIKIMEYGIPKLQRTELANDSDGEAFTVIFKPANDKGNNNK